MKTVEMSICGKRSQYTGPSCWGELTPAQAVACIRLRKLADEKPEALFPALKLLFGIPNRKLRWLFDDYYIRYKGLSEDEQTDHFSQGLELIKELSWIGDPDPDAHFSLPDLRLYDYHFGRPSVWVRQLRYRTRFMGPEAALSNCTFGEFMVADQAYRDGDFVKLTAALYRPVQQLAGRMMREPFDHDTLDLRTELFTRLDPAVISLVAQNFGDSLLVIGPYFRYVFQKAEEQDKDTQKGAAPFRWLDVIINMAQLDVTKIPLIEQQNVYLVLKTLNTQIRQAEEDARRLEALKEKTK